MSDYQGVLILAELEEGASSAPVTRELLGIGRKLADELGEPLAALVLGDRLDGVGQELISYGADKVYLAEHPLLEAYQSDAYVKVVSDLCQEVKAHVILLGKTDTGRELAPRVAFRLSAGLAVECMDLRIDPESKFLVAERPVYGGNAMAVVTCQTRPQMATIRLKAFSPLVQDPSRTGEVVQVPVQLDPSLVRAKVLSRARGESSDGTRLEDADIIVAGGRGLGGPEPFQMLEELAKLLKGAVGASRAVCDAGWMPPSYQVGLTGKTVSPNLYIAVSISGASQHMAGCSGAKNIVVINKDPDANMFKEARFGVVGDWREVLPAFIATVQELAGP